MNNLNFNPENFKHLFYDLNIFIYVFKDPKWFIGIVNFFELFKFDLKNIIISRNILKENFQSSKIFPILSFIHSATNDGCHRKWAQ